MNNFTKEYIGLCKCKEIQGLRDELEYGVCKNCGEEAHKINMENFREWTK